MAKNRDILSDLLKQYHKKEESHEICLRLDVADIIIRELDRQKIDCEELAKRLGESVAHVEHIVNGWNKLNLKEIGNIFYALGIRCEVRIKPKKKGDLF